MAVYSAKTAALIAEEALNRVGIASPSTAQKTRVKDVFLRNILMDIWTSRNSISSFRLKTLQDEYVIRGYHNISRYEVPTGFDEEISLTLLDYDSNGQATAGATSSITIATGLTPANVVGRYLYLFQGTGKGQLRQIYSYDAGTGVAQVMVNWGTIPDATTYYAIVSAAYKLDEEVIEYTQGISGTFDEAQPTSYTKMTTAGIEYFILNCPLDKSNYGILVKYYANPILLDETGTTITNLLNRWYHVLFSGTTWLTAEDEDDDRSERFYAEYVLRKTDLLEKEKPLDVKPVRREIVMSLNAASAGGQ